MFRLCALAAAAACAAAQDWGTVGAWERVQPVPSASGAVASPPRAYHHACSVPGYLVVAGNDTTQPGGAGDLYLYNIPANSWSAPFDYVPFGAAGARAPFVFAQGGYVGLVDETLPNAFYVIDASLPSGPWATTVVTGAPAARVAQRFLSWGSTLYMFGGFDTVALTQNNDLFALDLNAAIQGTPQAWLAVSPPAVAGLVPNYPPPRVGYSWTGYQVCAPPLESSMPQRLHGGARTAPRAAVFHLFPLPLRLLPLLQVGAILYGGLSIDGVPGGSPFTCFRTPTAAGCHFHTHVWAFLPSLGNGKAAGGMPAAAWVMLTSDVGANGGPVPLGRFEHVAGSMGDQLYVYGGITVNGPSSELWTYNLVSQTWAQILSTNPWPSAPSPGGFGWSTGAVIGRHLYVACAGWGLGVPPPAPSSSRRLCARATAALLAALRRAVYEQSWQSPAPGQLWRWAPSASSGGPPAAGSGANMAIINGHTAGIAITVLLCTAILAFSIMSAQQLGAVPSCTGLSRSVPKIGPAGFYSSSTTASSAAAVNGGYVAPPDTL